MRAQRHRRQVGDHVLRAAQRQQAHAVALAQAVLATAAARPRAAPARPPGASSGVGRRGGTHRPRARASAPRWPPAVARCAPAGRARPRSRCPPRRCRGPVGALMRSTCGAELGIALAPGLRAAAGRTPDLPCGHALLLVLNGLRPPRLAGLGRLPAIVGRCASCRPRGEARWPMARPARRATMRHEPSLRPDRLRRHRLHRPAGGRVPAQDLWRRAVRCAWAMAGRNLDKLAATRREIGAPQTLPLLQADAADAAALAALVPQARVILSTVGPYQLHGEPLLRACADAGTDYVDLCGEPLWMAQMIDRHEAAARASGARIVFSCGFDSIPFDLGVVFLQAEAQRRFGQPLQRVRGRVRVMKGGFSGGTHGQRAGHGRGDRPRPQPGAHPGRPLCVDAGLSRPGAARRRRGRLRRGGRSLDRALRHGRHQHQERAPHATRCAATPGAATSSTTNACSPAAAPAANAAPRRWRAPPGCRTPCSASARRASCCAASCCPSRARGRASASATTAATKCCSSATPREGQRLRAVVRGDRDPGYGSTCKLDQRERAVPGAGHRPRHGRRRHLDAGRRDGPGAGAAAAGRVPG